MTDPHTYFRKAAATLEPDVESLVSGSLERGRRTRRRRTTLATVAAGVAVVAVTGVAVAVPQLLGDSPTRIAPAGPGHPEESARDEALTDRQQQHRRAQQDAPAFAVRPADVPQAFVWIVGGHASAEQTYPGDHGGVISSFRWNGAYTTLIFDRVTSGRAPMAECRYLSQSGGVEATCEERPDGSVRSTWQERQPVEDGGVTGRGYTLFTTDGWSVDIISYNAASPKATGYVAPEPPLSYEQLEKVATDDTWFVQP